MAAFAEGNKTTVTIWHTFTKDQEAYLQLLAVDKHNFVYCGIGTARANIVAVDPKTGRKTSLLPEELRKTGSATVLTGRDGYVYRIENGKAAGRVAAQADPASIRPARVAAGELGAAAAAGTKFILLKP